MPASPDLATLERELEQLKQQLPRHSISPGLQGRIDELEEQIAALKEEASNGPTERK
jgi:polyhydroxyalkanoate synthesis regulator phasin